MDANTETLQTLVVDMDNTLIHAYPRWYSGAEEEIPHNTDYKCVKTELWIIFVNHVLVALIKAARLKSIKTVLWTHSNERYMSEILEACKLEDLFDTKLNCDNVHGYKKILRCHPDKIIGKALIIDDTKNKIDENRPDEYLVVEDFMELAPTVLEQEYFPVYTIL